MVSVPKFQNDFMSFSTYFKFGKPHEKIIFTGMKPFIGILKIETTNDILKVHN